MFIALHLAHPVTFKVTLTLPGNTLGTCLRCAAMLVAIIAFARSGGAGAAISCSQAPAHYVCSAIDVPGAGSTRANGISNNGTISGFYEAPGTSFFRLSGDAFDLPPVPSGAPAAYGFGVNDSGHLVGYTLSTSGYRGFLWNGSAYSSVAYPGANDTFAFGINSAGMVAGAYQTSPTSASGFLLTGSSYETVNAPNAKSTYVYGVNDAEVAAGTYISNTGEVTGFMKNGTSFADVRVPGAMQTYVRGINNIGDVAGHYIDSVGATHGFAKLSDGTFWTFRVSDALRTYLTGINDWRAISGYFMPNDYFSSGFSANLKPVPLPAAGLLLASALILLGRGLSRTRIRVVV